MDFNRKLEILLRDIREIENDAVDVSNAQELSKIEMDLLMEKVRRLYDHLIYIDRHYPYSQTSDRQEVPFEVTDKQAARQNKPHPATVSDEENRDADKDQPTAPTDEESSETSHQQVQDQPDAARQEENTWKGSGDKKTEGPEIVADKYQNSRTFRHDDLAKKQPQNNLSTRMQSRPINDLTKAIGLNEKFLFVRELFAGDKEKYHEAIQIINEMPSFEEAQAYIHERFNWDEEQPEVKKFMDLVRRKFSMAQ